METLDFYMTFCFAGQSCFSYIHIFFNLFVFIVVLQRKPHCICMYIHVHIHTALCEVDSNSRNKYVLK